MLRLIVRMRARRLAALGMCVLAVLAALAGCDVDDGGEVIRDVAPPSTVGRPSSTDSSAHVVVVARTCQNAGLGSAGGLQWTVGGGVEAAGAGQVGALLSVAGLGAFDVAADGSRLDGIGADWGTQIGESRYRLEAVTTVSGSPDGRWAAVAGCLGRLDASQTAGGEASTVREYAAGQVDVASLIEFHEILSWNRRTGVTRPLAAGRAPAWAPDGERLAFLSLYDYGRAIAVRRGPRLYVMPAAGGQPLEVARSVVGAAAWAPDSRHLAFLVDSPSEKPGSALHRAADDGTGQARLATNVFSPPAWSPDGRRLAYARHDGETLALYTVGVDGAETRRVTTMQGWGESPTRHWIPWIPSVAWSPDGAHLLYTCGQQVCVVAEDGTPVGRSPVGLNIGAWSPDGSRVAVAATDEPAPSQKRTTTIALASMAPDGGDVQPLVRWVSYQKSLVLVLWGGAPPPTPAPVDDCTNGQVVPAWAENPGLVQDCRTLMDARDVLRTYSRLNWDLTKPLWEWDGVKVSGSPLRVRSLDLREKNLFGQVPSALGRLDALEWLRLSRNGLTGSVPAALGKLAALRVLELNSNQLRGEIPVELVALEDLQFLFLGSNELTGCIPAALREIPTNDLDAFPTCATP